MPRLLTLLAVAATVALTVPLTATAQSNATREIRGLMADLTGAPIRRFAHPGSSRPVADRLFRQMAGEWEVTRYRASGPFGGMRPADEALGTHRIAIGRDGGWSLNDGCNQLTGRFVRDGAGFEVETLGSTRRMCIRYVPNAFLPLFREASHARVEGSRLTLLRADGLPLIAFRRLR